MKGEISRKLIHYSSASIPIGYYFLDKQIALTILIPLVFLMLLVEILKYKSDAIYELYMKFFKEMLREHEYDTRKLRMNGATWVLIADVICILLFPKLIAITGMLMLSLADSTSGLIGRVFGRKHFVPNRSIPGTAAFFIVGVLIIIFAPKYHYSSTEYVIGFFAVLGTTIVDVLTPPVDDNLSIPIAASALLYVLYLIFLPGIFAG